MNYKVLLAFLAGIVAASGVFYVAAGRRPVQTAQVVTPQTQPAQPVAAVTAPEPAPEPPQAPVQPAPVKPARKPEKALAPVAIAPKETPAEPLPVAPEPKVVEPAPVPHPAPAVIVAEEPPPPPAPVRRLELQPQPGIETKVQKATEPAQPNAVTLNSGTQIVVRLSESLSSNRNAAGDAFSAALDEPLVVDGFVIAERGARAEGRVVQADRSRRAEGPARLVLELTRITTSDGQNVAIRTSQVERAGQSSTGGDIAKVAVGTALGAIIGAAAGGGKGAAIGAAAGGAAGVGTAAATRGKPATLASETRLSFRIDESVMITERVR